MDCNCKTRRTDKYGLVHLNWCNAWRPEWIRRASMRVEQPVQR